MTRHMARVGVFALALLTLGVTSPRPARATTYTWSSTGTDWATAANWSPSGGPPDTPDVARFTPNGASVGTTVQNPNVATGQGVLALTFAPNQNLGGWTVTGSVTANLAVGGSGSTGLTTYGPATYTVNGPLLVGASASNLLNFNVGNGSTFVLAGNTTAATNLGNINVKGGTFRLDNSGTALARLANAGTITLTGGGTFELVGNASSSVTENVGALSSNANVIGGVNTIRVTPNGQATTLVFANSGTTRPGTRGVYQYVATNGNLGDSNGAKITFAGTPPLGANGLLAQTSGAGTVGFAIATDAGGTDFATWNATNGVIRATPTQTGTTASDLQSYTASDRVQFNPATNQTATATITNGSLRITPAASGLTLAMGTNNLTTAALMLDGSIDYTISGTGAINANAPRYVYVNNASTTLSTSLVVASGSNPTVFAGPGFVDLTGTGSQNTLTTTNRFVIAGGTVRGNNTQIGFTSSGLGIISFGGGVLEIKNGSNGTGTSADFIRALGANAGNVTWGAGSGNEVGSGGFSAFGHDASVNIGGAATPTALQWGQTNFVGDGFALIFGSTKSNAVLTFLNPLQLDNGSAYALREIKVIGGAGGDKTVFSDVISGAANADLLKTGTGILELAGANTYAGNTYIAEGTLRVGADGNLGSATNRIVITNGAVLNTSASFTLSSTRGLGLGDGGGTINTDSGTTLTYAGTITGSSLTKTGNGTLTLSGANTYSGGTTISAGTLLVTNTSGSGTGTGSVAVNSGGTLGGNNTSAISGPVTVASGGTVAPGTGGTSTGTLLVANNVTFQSSSAFITDVRGSAAGTGYDQLRVTAGDVALNGTYTALFGGFSPDGTERIWIIDNTGSGDLTGTFSNYTTSGSVVASFGGFDWGIFYNADHTSGNLTGGNDVVLVPVPESGHVFLACAAAGGLGYAVRRRFRF